MTDDCAGDSAFVDHGDLARWAKLYDDLPEIPNGSEYRPLYAEKRCIVCGSWRGQHTPQGDPALDAAMTCPVDASAKRYFETVPTFIPDAFTRGELDRRAMQFPAEQPLPGPDLAKVNASARDAWQRLIERRIAAGHAAEEATIRAELVAAVRDALETVDEDNHFGVGWDALPTLAEAAVDAVIAFISKPREGKSTRP